MITVLLILFSWGWSILSDELEETDAYIPLVSFVGIVHVLITGLGKINDDSYNKFHQYDAWAGTTLMVLRFMFYIYYICMLRQTYTKAKKKVKDWVETLYVFGSQHFLFFILIIIGSNFFEHYCKLKIVTYGILTV